jgi:hypothetical protein
MNLICPVCKFEIPEKLIDFSSESAICPHCQKDFDCSNWIEQEVVTSGNLQQPPSGAWFAKTDRGFKVGVSTRSYKWLVFIPIAGFWSGLMLFLTWGVSHIPDRETLIILLLFLTPLYLLGLFLWSCALMSICGKVEVIVDGDSGTISKGIGAMSWKRRFDWDQIKKIRISKYYHTRGHMMPEQQITLEGEKVFALARAVRAERLRFMLIALRLMCRNRN